MAVIESEEYHFINNSKEENCLLIISKLVNGIFFPCSVPPPEFSPRDYFTGCNEMAL